MPRKQNRFLFLLDRAEYTQSRPHRTGHSAGRSAQGVPRRRASARGGGSPRVRTASAAVQSPVAARSAPAAGGVAAAGARIARCAPGGTFQLIPGISVHKLRGLVERNAQQNSRHAPRRSNTIIKPYRLSSASLHSKLHQHAYGTVLQQCHRTTA